MAIRKSRRIAGSEVPCPQRWTNVVPWGGSLDEYVRMFDLSAAELQSRILDCAAGPSSFNAEMHQRGRTVVSCDPIYGFSADEIARRIDETYETILKATEEARDKFAWREIEAPEHLGRIRMDAMKRFLADCPLGLAHGRYRAAKLPALPFRDSELDLALCSHFLFTYSEILTLDFHLASIREMCRVARETRIFPLLPSFGQAHSSHVQPVLEQLRAEGYRCEIRRVSYEFQHGANEMLCAKLGTRTGCPI